MRVYIKTEQLEKILRNMVGYDGEVAFIYSANEIIAATDFERAEQIYIDMTELVGNNQGTGNWYGVHSEDGIRYSVSIQQITDTDWKMVSAIPVRELQRGIMRLSGLWFLIIVIVSIFSLYLAARIAGNIIGRRRLLEKNMACLAKGNFEKMTEDIYQDEISGLIRHYNSLSISSLRLIRISFTTRWI